MSAAAKAVVYASGFLLAFAFAGLSNAQRKFPDLPTAIEYMQMPPYCKVKLEGTAEEQKPWQAKLDARGDWQHIHHLCGAYLHYIRYFRPGLAAIEKKNQAHNAFLQIDYVLSGLSPSFYLRPQLHFMKARILAAEKKPGDAIREYYKSIELLPSNVPAYIGLADLFEGLKQREDAVGAIEKGLAQLPENQSLLKRYQALVGKPYVNPQTAESRSAPSGPRQTESPSGSSEVPQKGESPPPAASN